MIKHARNASVPLLIAVGLTAVFWRPLWTGGGFIGGDVYYYYYPQKDFLADRLRAGEFPLWNNRTGHGYPLIGESQTAAWYPPNPILYSTLDLKTAYNVNHLFHYVFAFSATWLYARRVGMAVAGSALSALVFTYGWFPSRCCLEWAIIGGAYLPLALWCVESFAQTRRARYAAGLAAALALQMLAGHFQLAFITQLAVLGYAALRHGRVPRRAVRPETTTRQATDSAHPGGDVLRPVLTVIAAILCAFGLAAVQLVPSWELKQHSRRAESPANVEPAWDGHIPPLYLTQVFAPWWWYTDEIDLDAALQRLDFLAAPAPTNKVEAHLYFGLIPFALLIYAAVAHRHRVKSLPEKTASAARSAAMPTRVWMLLGVLFLILATGWPLMALGSLPGFGFFRGAGRYGIVTALAAALFAGNEFGRLLSVRRSRRSALLLVIVFGVTVADLWWVSRRVTYSYLLDRETVRLGDDSFLSPLLTTGDGPARVFAPGPNLCNLLDVAATPVYLGLMPAEYGNPHLTMPAPPTDADGSDNRFQHATPEQIEWLQRAGVTHVIGFQPLDTTEWPAEKLWSGNDPFLSLAYMRGPREPIYLSRLDGSRGRVAFTVPNGTGTARITEYTANRVAIDARSTHGGIVILTDLYYPGWEVTINGEPAEPIRIEGMYRGVNVQGGAHTINWHYRPRSVQWGAAISIVSLLVFAGFVVRVEWFAFSDRVDRDARAPATDR